MRRLGLVFPMTWIITDAAGDEHEILEDERVLILALNQPCAQDWMRQQGLPPYVRQFKPMPSPRALEGYRPQTIVVLDCFSPGSSLHHNEIREIVTRSVTRQKQGVKWIEGACR